MTARMTRQLFVLPLLASILLLAGCQSQSKQDSPAEQTDPTPVTILGSASGTQGGTEEVVNTVLPTKEAAAAFSIDLSELTGMIEGDDAIYVVATSGQQSTGGHSIEITEVSALGTVLIVNVKKTAPGPDDMVTQALTTPWSAVAVPVGDYTRARFIIESAE